MSIDRLDQYSRRSGRVDQVLLVLESKRDGFLSDEEFGHVDRQIIHHFAQKTRSLSHNRPSTELHRLDIHFFDQGLDGR